MNFSMDFNMSGPLDTASGPFRRLEPQWNHAMIAASIAISFLGAFTSTQLMCHASMTLHFTSAFIWTVLGSLIFGFCSIWCLHEVAMLACELDVPVGVDAPLTVLSSVLAVFFTFAALASGPLWDKYYKRRKKLARKLRRSRASAKRAAQESTAAAKSDAQGSVPLLRVEDRDQADEDDEEESDDEDPSAAPRFVNSGRSSASDDESDAEDVVSPMDVSHASASPRLSLPTFKLRDSRPGFPRTLSGASWTNTGSLTPTQPTIQSPAEEPSDRAPSVSNMTDTLTRTSSDYSTLRRGSSGTAAESSTGSFGLSSVMGIAYRKGTATSKNAVAATVHGIWNGCTLPNFVKSFAWSIAVTSMHYVGISALRIPQGYYQLNPWLVLTSGLISWTVCLVGCILMSKMETHLSQQLLFSAVASAGVAAMHFTGMRAATFWTRHPPSEVRGYPPALATAVVGIAFTTCIAANCLLAHSATVSRNKLAEIVWTRRELWRTIAQKENAEAAAMARSEFIASASHEIRTPLHHLQGYGDLLSQTELTEEGRTLLSAIQRATKTLSLITNNVLDWSKLEKDAEGVCRPVALDMRVVCESIIVLLPNKDEEADVELFVVVAPDVPAAIYLDETYIHRVLMNLLSNAMKFTRSGYIMLSIEVKEDKLIATVKDTGCGLDEAFIPHMWTPFKQGEIRGSQRGTGLGLSIIKQLLHKMNGTIELESKSINSADVLPERTGSTFTITIPIPTTMIGPERSLDNEQPKIAILTEGESRYFEGLRTSWEKFGFEVTEASHVDELPKSQWKYIWADLPFLKNNVDQYHQLSKNEGPQVLVPYDTQDSLKCLPGIFSVQRFVLLQRPLIWHAFEKRIAAASQRSRNTTLPRTLRFASTVEVLGDKDTESHQEDLATPKSTILLVEDNPINQKLGKKMLTALGYHVLTADDGEDAIEQIIRHDATVDAILMDQSMPKKDGITATKEIRELESAAVLSRRRPIIAVTAVVNPQAQALFQSAGADDFLAKPLALLKLKDTLAVYLPKG